eukprot:scaffold2178_cov323-Prasinococcus_capsulatus_cf.AAC.2
MAAPREAPPKPPATSLHESSSNLAERGGARPLGPSIWAKAETVLSGETLPGGARQMNRQPRPRRTRPARQPAGVNPGAPHGRGHVFALLEGTGRIHHSCSHECSLIEHPREGIPICALEAGRGKRYGTEATFLRPAPPTLKRGRPPTFDVRLWARLPPASLGLVRKLVTALVGVNSPHSRRRAATALHRSSTEATYLWWHLDSFRPAAQRS